METNLGGNTNVSHQGLQGNNRTDPGMGTKWTQMAESDTFKVLIQRKKSFLIPATIFFFLFYFILPVLTAFTTSLNGKVIGAINWAYLYAFAQFVMTWWLSHLYLKKARRFDELSQKVKEEAAQRGVNVE